MTAESALISRTFAVGWRYRCTLTVPAPRVGAVACMVAEWEPSLPKRLSAAELADYRRGRDAIFAEAAAMTGGNVFVIE